MDNQFIAQFIKHETASTSAVYEIYAAAAEALWKKYSVNYELRPRNPKKVRDGKNRGIEFYKDGKHLAEISVGKTTTLYVLDDYLRSKLPISYNMDSRGRYRHTFDSFEDCMMVLQAV